MAAQTQSPSAPLPIAPGPPRRSPSRPGAPCVFFAKGTCRNGGACPFSHAAAPPSPPSPADGDTVCPPCDDAPDSPASSAPSPRPANGARMCRFFVSGNCRAGAACKFSHGQHAATATAPAHSAETTLLLQRLASGALSMFALDVECVATGPCHNDRAVAQVGLVDAFGRCILNIYVKPEKPVVSYMTPLTGLTAELVQRRGVPFDEAVSVLRSVLPPAAALIGTNIGQDARWLGLAAPRDFALLVDLSALFRAWDGSKYVYFGQDHCAKVWLGAVRPPGTSHDAVGDAAVSMALLGRYMRTPEDVKLNYHEWCLTTPREKSFAVLNPVFEGVCQGNRRLCKCGAPHLS